MIQVSADVNAPDFKCGTAALASAAQSSDTELVQFLLGVGAGANAGNGEWAGELRFRGQRAEGN